MVANACMCAALLQTIFVAEPGKTTCMPDQATVEEALWFSARLRLAKDISNERMWAFINEVPCSPHLHLDSQRDGRCHACILNAS